MFYCFLKGSPCQQIRQPVCGQATSCNPASQQCCGTQSQRICRQVPQRVVTRVKQTLPGQATWRQECQTVQYNVTVVEYDDVLKPVNHTVKDCNPLQKTECHDFKIPQYTVVSEKKTDKVIIFLFQLSWFY